jgi:hypothetical protein
MNKKQTHDRKTEKKDYYGKSDAVPLLVWLNRISSRKDEVARMALAKVTLIMDAIARIQDKAAELMPMGGWKSKPKAIRNEEAALNARLSDYEFVHGLDFSKSSPMVWVLRSMEDPTGSTYIAGETLAVHHVVELAKKGLVGKVRRCDCGRYFFARLPSQRFHGKECRVQFWEESPQRKARRREKASEYYNLHKSGKVR